MEEKKIIRVGLAGNPNSGKTTIFNALTGARQKVGNYAGVTVEKKEGKRNYKDIDFIIYDLPGVYSLTAYSMDEVVTRDFIIDEKPDIIIDVLDSTNIERNLYMLLQFQELGIPLVGALNISDQAESMGIRIDSDNLSKVLGLPLVKTIGTKGIGVEELLDKVIMLYDGDKKHENKISYGYELENEISILQKIIEEDKNFSKTYSSRWLSIKILEKDKNAYEKLATHLKKAEVEKKAAECIKRTEEHFGNDSEIVVSEQRYAYVHGAVTESVKKMSLDKTYITETIDKVLINRFLGLPIFLFILWGIFQITFILGEYPMGWLEAFFGLLSDGASSVIPEGIFRNLVVDGIIGGVGGVLSFVPLIIILFLCISILEDSGYMSRAAFIMDKFLHIFGLHGQSFMPMMIGFGCSVPAVMASRSLKNPRDRITTILIIPFMSCGAKLPVHVLLAAAFFKENASNMVLLIYIIGVALALVSSKILKMTVLKGEATPFVMELPPYRLPTLRGIWFHVWDKTVQYLKKAGTVLLAASIIIWAMITFPQIPENEEKYNKLAETYSETIDKDLVKTDIDQYIEVIKREEKLSYSIAGRIGKVIEPIIKPIGFDWKIGISAITGFAAKEVVVSTLGILYKVGTEESEESASLRDALIKSETFNPLVAFVLMLFTLIVAPCFATLATIKAELGWKWLGFHFVATLILAWGLCFAVFQIGMATGVGIL